MEINSISRYTNVSPYQQLLARDFAISKASQFGYLSAIEPISPIVGRQSNPIIDTHDIDYEQIRQYEEQVFGRRNQNQPEPTLSALPQENAQENNFIQELGQAINQTNSNDTVRNNRQSNREENPKYNNELTEEQQAQVRELERIDNEVRTHEQAHLSAGGSLVRGGASYSYTQGPDGKQYATGGEVNIDMSSEDTPAATIAKMQQVIAAAMAPAKPSSQDYSVAAAANKVIAESRMQEARQRTEEENNTTVENSAENNTVQTAGINSETENPIVTNSNSINSNNTTNSSRASESQPFVIGMTNQQLSTYENQINPDNIYKQQHLGKITNQVA
jgi:hypothetical protein